MQTYKQLDKHAGMQNTYIQTHTHTSTVYIHVLCAIHTNTRAHTYVAISIAWGTLSDMHNIMLYNYAFVYVLKRWKGIYQKWRI